MNIKSKNLNCNFVSPSPLYALFNLIYLHFDTFNATNDLITYFLKIKQKIFSELIEEDLQIFGFQSKFKGGDGIPHKIKFKFGMPYKLPQLYHVISNSTATASKSKIKKCLKLILKKLKKCQTSIHFFCW